jgi:hypothetical protein
MSDPRPECPKCKKNDQVFEDDKKKVTKPRFWRCLRCDMPIRKMRL